MLLTQLPLYSNFLMSLDCAFYGTRISPVGGKVVMLLHSSRVFGLMLTLVYCLHRVSHFLLVPLALFTHGNHIHLVIWTSKTNSRLHLALKLCFRKPLAFGFLYFVSIVKRCCRHLLWQLFAAFFFRPKYFTNPLFYVSVKSVSHSSLLWSDNEINERLDDKSSYKIQLVHIKNAAKSYYHWTAESHY